MKKLAAVGLILFFVAGFAYAEDYEVKKKAGEYEVEVKIDSNPPVASDNTILKGHMGSNLLIALWKDNMF